MLDESRIERQCKARGFSVQFGAGVIYINTGKANWRLMHDGIQVYKVMHENYRGLKFNTGKYNSGFHEQKLWNFQIKNILNYIEKHDQLFLSAGTSEYDKMTRHASCNQRLSIA